MRKYLPKLLGRISVFFPITAAKIAIHFFATPIRIPRPKSELEWHASAKKYFLKDGIAAFEWGESTDPLVLLIHGWNGRGTQLASFAAALVEKKFRVVALDGPGHGISSGKMTNPVHYADFIANAQKEILGENKNESHAIVAHSFGGACTVLAASRGLKTKGVVLVASPAFYDRVAHFFARSMNLTEKSEQCFFEIITGMTGIPPKDINLGLLGGKLNLPALIVHDIDDKAVDFMSAEAIIKNWPASSLLKTSGLGHRRILKDQEVIQKVAEFVGALR